MRRLTLLLLSFLALPAFAAEPTVDDLKWIAGHWTATINGVESEELWLPPSGNLMLGLHRDVKGTRASFEFIRIAMTKDGVAYLAQPGGKPATAFKLVEATPKKAVFENPAHDFPTRIVYWMKGAQLCAAVEGKMDGKDAREEWCWSKR
jgi:Domain of unknown function (DUF6265)